MQRIKLRGKNMNRKIFTNEQIKNLSKNKNVRRCGAKSVRYKKSFKESIELDPDFMNARYNLALCNFYSGNYENAISLLEGIIEREPYFERMPHLYSYLGWCNFHLGKYEESISLFQRSLDEKEISGSLLGKGLCLEQLGRIEEARTVLLRMVEIAPDDSKIEEAHNALERIAKL